MQTIIKNERIRRLRQMCMMPCDRGAEEIMKILKRAMRLADKAGTYRTKDARNIVLHANATFFSVWLFSIVFFNVGLFFTSCIARWQRGKQWFCEKEMESKASKTIAKNIRPRHVPHQCNFIE